jgi:hypothetical protein
MVLQRGAPIPVWGFLPAGTQVDATLGGAAQSATADASGRWAVTFPPLPAGGPYELAANASSGQRELLEDVLVGDVILCSGQSNMDMPVSYSFNASAEAAAAALYPSVRYFYVSANYSAVPLREFITVSRWAAGSPAGVASSFSAVCWFTARDTFDGLRAAGLGDVPIGMVHSALGGTPIQEWLSAAAAASCPAAQPPMYPKNSGLFNAMVSPMISNGLRVSHTIWCVALLLLLLLLLLLSHRALRHCTLCPSRSLPSPPRFLSSHAATGTKVRRCSAATTAEAAATAAPQSLLPLRPLLLTPPHPRPPPALPPSPHFLTTTGEANVQQAPYYACLLTALSDDWQRGFQHSGTPGRFFVAQLHAWNASTDPANVYYQGAIAGLRAAQAAGVAASPGAELATAIDGGDPQAPATSIHPRGKQLPGMRLARAILARRFGVPNVAYAAPRYASASASAAGAALTVRVALATSAGGGAPALAWRAPTPASNSSRCPTDLGVLPLMCAGFEVMLSDAPFPRGTWVPAAAAVDAAGTGLVLSAQAPRAGLVAAGSRNGWGAWPVVNVYTVDGELPVLPWQEAL